MAHRGPSRPTGLNGPRRVRLRCKRVYDAPAATDGARILVDRLWPRGLTKAKARVDHWVREIAPSNELRRWYGHDPAKWTEFRRRYFAELDARPDETGRLRHLIGKAPATFLYSSKEPTLNNATALVEYLQR